MKLDFNLSTKASISSFLLDYRRNIKFFDDSFSLKNKKGGYNRFEVLLFDVERVLNNFSLNFDINYKKVLKAPWDLFFPGTTDINRISKMKSFMFLFNNDSYFVKENIKTSSFFNPFFSIFFKGFSSFFSFSSRNFISSFNSDFFGFDWVNYSNFHLISNESLRTSSFLVGNLEKDQVFSVDSLFHNMFVDSLKSNRTLFTLKFFMKTWRNLRFMNSFILSLFKLSFVKRVGSFLTKFYKSFFKDLQMGFAVNLIPVKFNTSYKIYKRLDFNLYSSKGIRRASEYIIPRLPAHIFELYNSIKGETGILYRDWPNRFGVTRWEKKLFYRHRKFMHFFVSLFILVMKRLYALVFSFPNGFMYVVRNFIFLFKFFFVRNTFTNSSRFVWNKRVKYLNLKALLGFTFINKRGPRINLKKKKFKVLLNILRGIWPHKKKFSSRYINRKIIRFIKGKRILSAEKSPVNSSLVPSMFKFPVSIDKLKYRNRKSLSEGYDNNNLDLNKTRKSTFKKQIPKN